MYRHGIGWDLHPLQEGRELFLGGVHFEGEPRGLAGHSDADVVCHAIVDALYGAAALGDIGDHFPDTDPKFKDFPGPAFLEKARKEIKNAGYTIVNIDCTVMSDVLRLGRRKQEMAVIIASHLGIDRTRVSVKATTWEGLGMIGRGEAIACQAVATIMKEDG